MHCHAPTPWNVRSVDGEPLDHSWDRKQETEKGNPHIALAGSPWSVPRCGGLSRRSSYCWVSNCVACERVPETNGVRANHSCTWYFLSPKSQMIVTHVIAVGSSTAALTVVENPWEDTDVLSFQLGRERIFGASISPLCPLPSMNFIGSF